MHAALSISRAACSTLSDLAFFSSRGIKELTKPSMRKNEAAIDVAIGNTAAAAEKAKMRSSFF